MTETFQTQEILIAKVNRVVRMMCEVIKIHEVNEVCSVRIRVLMYVLANIICTRKCCIHALYYTHTAGFCLDSFEWWLAMGP